MAAFLGVIAGQAPRPSPRAPPQSLAVLALAGGALMAHDWQDRSVWFERGRGPMGYSAR